MLKLSVAHQWHCVECGGARSARLCQKKAGRSPLNMEELDELVVGVDVPVFRFFDEQTTHYQRHGCNDDWVPQPVINIAVLRN
jgi:hypothetical protein